MSSEYEKIFETAGWIQFDDDTAEWWIENLFKPLPREDPVRLLKAIDLVENNTDWYFDRVDDDKFLRFDKSGDTKAKLFIKSAEDAERYVNLVKRSA